MILAAIDFESPLTWAILIGWIMTVVLHEFAHGIVAYFGGDYTIKERGGLTLNPIQYIDPFGSILLPAIFLALGGIPLPGGATYIHRELLRSRAWDAAVSAAGPAMNLLLFLLLSLPFHPAIGWITVDPNTPESWTPTQMFLVTLAQLQFIAIVINLIPLPPLDGFQIVGAFMDEETRQKLMSMSFFSFIVLFLVIMRTPGLWTWIFSTTARVYLAVGFDADFLHFAITAFFQSLGLG
ncbi:MAG TPA: site-2 protease family protein [Tepidisphaeraceae bacterium]|nr:site-2 protease family protein [Tepidisphaeraceae bacterium]